MSKDRNWMDHVRLAWRILSVLGKLRKGNRQKKARRLRLLRLLVGVNEAILHVLESDTSGTETPLQRQFVLTCDLERDLKKRGMLPPLEFELRDDLDRIKKLENRLAALRGKLLKAMPADQGRDAELCVKYLTEEPDLGKLIMACSGKKSLERKEKTIVELEAELKATIAASPIMNWIIGAELWGRGLSLVSIVLMFLGYIILPGGDFPKALLTILLVTLLVGFLMLVGLSFLREAIGRKVIPSEIRKLKDELGDLDEEQEGTSVEKIAALAGDRTDLVALTKKFGGVESEEKLRAMSIEHRDFVRGILGPNYFDRSEEESPE